MAATACRSGRHTIRSTQDRAPNGGCRKCQALNKRRYRVNVKTELAELRELAAKIRDLIPPEG